MDPSLSPPPLTPHVKAPLDDGPWQVGAHSQPGSQTCGPWNPVGAHGGRGVRVRAARPRFRAPASECCELASVNVHGTFQ